MGGETVPIVECIWDLEDDRDGNVQHIAEHGVTTGEAEEVLNTRYDDAAPSGSSGRPTVFGWTSTGKYLAVIFEVVDESLPSVYVVTAYEAPPPAERRRRRK